MGGILMKIGILDYERMIKVNKLKEVTSPWMVSNKLMYDPDGIFSNEIFGMSKDERRSSFGYIDLKRPFIHPHIYANVMKKGIFRDVVHILNGTKRFNVVDRRLEVDPNGWTGLTNFYKNWDNIDWSLGSSSNESSVKLLNSLKTNEAFITKLLVCPPAYRDIMIAGSIDASQRVHELNTYYVAIIRAVNILDEGGIFAERQYATQAKIQESLADIIAYCEKQISKKTGLIRKYLLGKRVDFGTRSVISAYSYNNETIKDNMVGLEHTAVPLSQCCAMYMPFVQSWLRQFFTRELINRENNYQYRSASGELMIGVIDNPEDQFSDKKINNLILDYIKNPDNRFQLLEVNAVTMDKKTKKQIPFKAFIIMKGTRLHEAGGSSLVERPMTITDLLYMACVDICEKRHISVTRYPVGTDKGLFLNRINVQSTIKHIRMVHNGKEYPFYPHIDFTVPKDRVGVQFIDTIVFSNSMLQGMGGDLTVSYHQAP